MDSGAFSQISRYGKWTVSPRQYATEARFYADTIGGMLWAATQDWMCEPEQIRKTGKTLRQHQRLTVQSYLDLMAIDPSFPWLPTLQGYELSDYMRCVDMYFDAGVDLCSIPTVGLGSVCRRQATREIAEVVTALADLGLRLHGFGIKKQGIERVGDRLVSSDSMAWSIQARYSPPLRGHSHKTCANCADYALRWYASVIQVAPASMPLPPPAETNICQGSW